MQLLLLNNKEKIESIIEEVILANRSAVWWQKEMNSCLAELKNLEEESFEIEYPEITLSEREELEERVEYLILKGEWEDNNLEKIMRRVDLFDKDAKRHIVTEIGKRWEESKKTPKK